MATDLLTLQPELPEWRRSGRFLLIAAALHGAVLFYPLQQAFGKLEMQQPSAIVVRLVEAVSAPAVAPPKPQAPVQQPTVSHPRERAMPTPRPVLAMTPEQAAPASFSVPAAAAPPAPPVASTAPAAATPATISAVRFDAAYLQNPAPKYPPLSRRLGEEGKVLLKVRVSADGLPATVELERSSSFERLDEAARQVVAHWRFVPAKRGDVAIEASVIVPIVFRLDS